MYTRVAPRLWHLSPNIPSRRRRRLLFGPTFEQICERLVQEARVVKHGREESRIRPGFFRLWVRVRVHPHALDLFHNSSSGYRAQYYQSRSLGERANAFALRKLSVIILCFLATAAKRTCACQWVGKSLRAPGRKVWIHQGLWLRYARCRDRLLTVDRWERERTSPQRDRAKKAYWSGLVPDRETDIEVFGGFVSLSGRIMGQHKECRAWDLNKLGFT
jgi:hypothetical protein